MSEPEPIVFIVDEDMQVQQCLGGLMKSVGLRAESYTTTQAFMEDHDPSRPGKIVGHTERPQRVVAKMPGQAIPLDGDEDLGRFNS